MRYTRPALTIATALLALTGLGTTAQADNNSDGKDGKSNICFIHVEGNHNHNACGSIKYGNNATTGQGHVVRLGSTDSCDHATIRLQNTTAPGVTVTADGTSGAGFYPGFAPPAVLTPGESATWCSQGRPNQTFTIAFNISVFGNLEIQGSAAEDGTRTWGPTPSSGGDWGMMDISTTGAPALAICTIGTPGCQEGS
ncbi:hypothetical protein [Streptomyces sp. NPDC086023]|uniref:hypothetical protein n=1 Tax=Streptomyces sp. NPDC086023 TaxID=3365746 RepID=UPI0037D56BDD